MKKIIIVSALLCSLLFVPVFASAQTTPTQDAVTQQLIKVLTQLIAQLEQEIQQILALQQSKTSTPPASAQTLQQIQQNLQPLEGVPNATLPPTISTPTPSPTPTPNSICPQYSVAVCGSDGKTYYGNPCLGYGMPSNVTVASQGVCSTPTPTPNPVCTPNWQCGGFGNCVNAQQSRTCADANNCGTTINEPPLTQSCNIPYITIGKTSVTNDSASTYAVSINFTVNASNVWSEIEFSTNSDFSSPMLSMISNDCVKGDNQGGRGNLNPNTKYYYRFIGADDCTWDSIANQNNLANNFTYSSEAESFTTYAPTCTPNWKCSGFGPCVNGQQTQTCTDNDCSITSGEPALTQSCTQ
ncbi:MAG: hypothetical protein ABSA74_00245 [Candidatus Staskawiczbacteria bacterium]|jgi:hypothetical protein